MIAITPAPEDSCDRIDQPVPIWVPDPGDPDGIEGSWQLVDPHGDHADPRRRAQAKAVAAMWRVLCGAA